VEINAAQEMTTMAFQNDAGFEDDFRKVGADVTAGFEPATSPSNPTEHASSENLNVAPKDDDLEDDDEVDEDDDLEDEDEDDDLEDDEDEDEEEDEDDDLEDDEDEDDEDEDDEEYEDDDEDEDEDVDDELEDDDDTVTARNTSAAAATRRR
jgi:hypothetical protein